MIPIREYLKETADLNRKIEGLTEFLNNSSLQLDELVKRLEEVFEYLKRGNNLIAFLRNYSRSFESQVSEFSKILIENRGVISQNQEDLYRMKNIFANTREITARIEENANTFIRLARTITYLEENIEVKAYQAREEGRGLAVVAREVFKIAQSCQVPFQHFGELLEVIEKNYTPLLEDLNRTIEDATVSSNSLMEFLTSLQAINESLDILQKFVRSMEESGNIFAELEKKINDRLTGAKDQLTNALATIDELSVRGAEISNLSQILYELYTITNAQYDPYGKFYAYRQFQHLLHENLNVLKILKPGVRPVLLSPELIEEFNHTTDRIGHMYKIIISARNEVENLNKMMDRILNIRLSLNQFFSNLRMVAEKIQAFKGVLREQLAFIENLIVIGTKIITRIKTLSIFSRLEQSHSVKSKELITPIVDEFIQLSQKMNSVFVSLESDVLTLKQLVGPLESFQSPKEFFQLSIPDFSRIKIFFDDTLRVFEGVLSHSKNLKELIVALDSESYLLQRHWDIYEQSLKNITKYQSYFSASLDLGISAPAVGKERRTLKINLLNDPVTLKPDKKTDATSQQVIANYSTGLFQFGFGVGVIPGISREYSVSSNGREYIFSIRENLRYANGKKLFIEDAKDGIIRALGGPNHNLLEMISGAREFMKTKDPACLRIKILDQYRMQINLEHPYLPFLANLATNIADPYIDGDLPVGMGPFRLLSWSRGKGIILEANDYYFEGRPAFDILEFYVTLDDDFAYELFKSGELSIFQPGHKSLQKIKEEMPELLVTVPELSVQFLCFHCQMPPFNNKLVRKAICHAINVEKFVNDLLKGMAVPARGFFPPSMPVFNKRLAGYRYDPTKSRELLSQAGFSSGLPDRYILDVSDTPASIRRAEFIQANLNEIGVRIEINPLPWHEFLEKVYRGEFLLCLQGWISDTGDPDNFVYPLFHSNSFGYSGNTFFFANNEVDKMIEDARQIRNIKQRWNYYRQIEEKILDEAPGVFLFHSLKNIGVQKGIRGFKINPLSIIRAKYLYSNFERFQKEDIFSRKVKPQFLTT
ncbi:MAG: ABC transporter substrate-binding protein [bacterium]